MKKNLISGFAPLVIFLILLSGCIFFPNPEDNSLIVNPFPFIGSDNSNEPGPEPVEPQPETGPVPIIEPASNPDKPENSGPTEPVKQEEKEENETGDKEEENPEDPEPLKPAPSNYCIEINELDGNGIGCKDLLTGETHYSGCDESTPFNWRCETQEEENAIKCTYSVSQECEECFHCGLFYEQDKITVTCVPNSSTRVISEVQISTDNPMPENEELVEPLTLEICEDLEEFCWHKLTEETISIVCKEYYENVDCGNRSSWINCEDCPTDWIQDCTRQSYYSEHEFLCNYCEENC